MSIMSFLPGGKDIGIPALDGVKLGVNYGWNRVRFMSPVKVGDLICTSGARGFLSEGMVIGVVAGVENVDADATLEIDIAPAADFEGLEAVAILVRGASWEKVERPR